MAKKRLPPQNPVREGDEPSNATVPNRFPETNPPPGYPSSDFSFTLQGVYDLKGTAAALEQTVRHLKESVDEQRGDLKSVQRTLWIATGGFAVVTAVGGFFLKEMWDTLMQVLELVRHQPPRP